MLQKCDTNSIDTISYGNGYVSYGLKLNQSENTFEFCLNAFPDTRASQLDKKDVVNFNRIYNISHNSISQLKNDLQLQFFDKFPQPEDYFDKIRSLEGIKYSGCQFLCATEANKLNMTTAYFIRKFDILFKSIGDSVEIIDQLDSSTTRCILF